MAAPSRELLYQNDHLSLWANKFLMQVPSIKKTSSFRSLMQRKGNSSNSLPRQKTVHSGWLWKKGVLNTQLVNRRWFEIKGDQMYYFKVKGDTNPLGQVALAGNEVKRHPISTDGSSKYTFEIIAGKERQGRPVVDNFESLLFAASSPFEMEEWIKSINRVIYTPLGGGMFGRSIRETLKIDSTRGGGMVPIIVELCVEYIRKHGLKEEGIFRIPGSKDEVEALKTAFNTGVLKDLNGYDHKVSIVASVLKQYLGDLPVSVIPPENYDPFIAVGGLYKGDPEIAIKKFADLLCDIPKGHFDLLKYLCRFLYELQLNHKETLMTVVNLGKIFGPNILRPMSEDPTDLLRCLSQANTTTMALISNQSKLFPVLPDEKSYDPNHHNVCDDLINLDLSPLSPVSTTSPKVSKGPSMISMRRNVIAPIACSIVSDPLKPDKRSFSDSSLADLQEFDRRRSMSNSPTNRDEIVSLKKEIQDQKTQFEEQIAELEKKLDIESKVREMFKIRLVDEQKARQAAEERLELYRSGIEDYCRKFGHVDIKLQ